MPEIIPIGWFHLAMGIVALVSGGIALARYKEISLKEKSGQIYLATTVITAATALVIFQHGKFTPAHSLAVMTLAALAVGMMAEKMKPFGKLSRYVQAISYSATLLFHCIPAVTDGLMRLPVGDPVLTSLEDPILKKCYLALLVLFLIGISLQMVWIRRHPAGMPTGT
jgi:uncharacterized membrane protein